MTKEYRFNAGPIDAVAAMGCEDELVDFEGLDPSEVVDNGTISVRFTYPLAKPVIGKFTAKEWTIAGMIRVICEFYQGMYDAEDATSDIPAGPHPEVILNRNTTNGTFGIWGHSIEDLCLSGFCKGDDGIYELEVQS